MAPAGLAQDKRQAIQTSATPPPVGGRRLGQIPRRPAGAFARALVRSLTRSLALSALLLGPGMLLTMLGLRLPGMAMLFLGSFWLMARTYRRPWRLNLLSCLIPPVVAASSYVLQLWLFAGSDLPFVIIAAAVGVGVVLGWWRGRSHLVYREGGSLFARRTFGYLVSWVLAYAFTQALAMTAANIYLIRAGLATGAFTTSLLVMVSLMMLRHHHASRSPPPLPLAHVAASLVFLLVTLGLAFTPRLHAAGFDRQAIDDAVASELKTALESDNIIEIFGAALAVGLNDELELTSLERVRESPEKSDTESGLGFLFSGGKFSGSSQGVPVKFELFMVSGQTVQNRLLISTLAPTGLDLLQKWLLSPDRLGEEGRFEGRIERISIGDHGIIASGPDKDKNASAALGIMINNGRALMVGISLEGGTHRADAARAKLLATLGFIESLSSVGPGMFKPLGERAATVSSATLVMLASAGIAVSLLQAIAAAAGQVVQVTAESAAQDVGNALAEPTGDDADTSRSAAPEKEDDAPPSPPPRPRGPDLHDKYGHPFDRSEDGRYWAPNDQGKWEWMDETAARRASAALRGEALQREAETRHHDAETQRILKESREAIRARNQAEEEAWQRAQAEQALADQLEREKQERLVGVMSRRAAEKGGALREEVGQLIADGNFAGLESLCRDELKNDIATGQQTAAAEQTYEKGLAAGEMLARATVAASRAALMAVGGPAGASGTALAVGTVSAAAEGAESVARGDSLTDVVKSTAVGFMSGAKDGALSVYTALPGTGDVPKLLVPAGGDALETFVRTGDLSKSLATGVNTLAGDIVGAKVGGIGNTAAREALSAATTVATAEAGNLINGGKFGDAFQNALVNHVGGKLGGHAGGLAARQAIVAKPPADPVVDHDTRVKEALAAANAGKKPIPLEEQGRSIQEIDGTRHREVQLDASGRPVVDADGNPVTTEFVNARKTLAELQETAQSRDAKMAPENVREALIRTRAEKIYKPADDATIERVTPFLKQNNMLRKDDRVVMDTFSTPGEKPSLGADRDARLVVLRPAKPDLDAVTAKLREDKLLNEGDTLVLKNSPDRDPSRPPGTDPLDQVLVIPKGAPADAATPLKRELWEKHDQIEIKREHWERIAQEEFFKHTTKVATSDGSEITPESHPEYFRRRAELEFMKRPDTPEAIAALQARGFSQEQIARLQQQGMTQEQIDAQAWAEAHNQLFTDRHHMEASADNADQATRMVDGRMESYQKTPSALAAKQREGTLLDPEGFARMWQEKSRFYDHNKPEAIAQSQKGIAGLMKIREGYRSQNVKPPPINETMAKAMTIVVEAPVGVKATPEAMQKVESDLRALGFRDLNDALGKIAMQNEMLKWSRPPGAADPFDLPRPRFAVGSEHREIGTSDLTRIAGMDRTGGSLEEEPRR